MNSGSESTTSAKQEKSNNAALFTAAAACALIVLDTNVVAVSLPAIAHSFHASFADIEWVVSAYIVTFAACLLPAGGIADQFGRKRTLLLGLAIFALASLACGLAPTALVLNVARAVKGMGAALLLTSALAVIANTFHEGPARLRAWAIWGACMGLATAVAPLVGGLITQLLSWRWIFLLNLPVTAILAVCAHYSLTESKNHDAVGVDAVGSALFGCALALLISTLISAPEHGWFSLASAWRLGTCVALFSLFIAYEARHPAAMVDLSLFRQPRFIAAVLAMFGYASAAQVMMTFLPLYLQNAYGFSPIAAGLGMLPFALAMIIGPYVGRRLARWLSTYPLLCLGLMLVALGNVLSAGFAGHASYSLAALGMMMTGLGAGVLNGDTQKAIMACVPVNRTGMASGISASTRYSGIVMSVGVLGAILNQRTHDVFDQAWSAERMNLVAQHHATASGELPPDFVASMLAGDLRHALAGLPDAWQNVAASIARTSFAIGFSSALYMAAAIAALSALIIYWLTRATAPRTRGGVNLPGGVAGTRGDVEAGV